MRIRKVPRQTPQGPSEGTAVAGTTPGGSPAAGGGLERRVWEELAPRLLHPTKLAFIQLLLESGEPLSLGELAKAVKIAKGHAGRHCRRMQAAGVLEVVAVDRAESEREEPFYFFPKPSEPATGVLVEPRDN
jgi:DNA-binding transcriptional ArsR family regulator